MPEKRLLEGDLVEITAGLRYSPQDTEYGIILKVLERNIQNPEWDKYLVMWDNQMDALPARRLRPVELNILSSIVQKKPISN